MIKGIIFDWGRVLYDADSKTLFPDTIEVLEALSRKYKLAIVALATDGDVERRLKVIRDNNLEKYFVSILFDNEDKDSLYTKVLPKLELQPKEVAIIDDRVIRGVRWGDENGAETVWVKKGKFSTELPNDETRQPTHTIYNLRELLVLY